MKIRYLIVVSIVLFLGVGNSLCWDFPNKIEGKAEIEFLHNFGDEFTGGFSYGKASGEYSASGPSGVSGEANAWGNGFGESFTTPTSAFSSSSSNVYSNASAGCVKTEIEISGIAAQGNWATIGNDQNFAQAGNTTSGEYSLKLKGNGPISAWGGANAYGFTTAFANEGETWKSAGFQTFGSSSSWLQGRRGDPKALGEGFGQAVSFMEKGGTAALAVSQGAGKYSASGPNYAGGYLNLRGNTNVSVTPNSVSAYSHSSSSASSWSW